MSAAPAVDLVDSMAAAEGPPTFIDNTSSQERYEFQLPFGDLGLELAPFSKDNEGNRVIARGCIIKGWKNLQNLNIKIPIGSKILLVDGEYVESLPFRDIVKRIQNSHERILIVDISACVVSDTQIQNKNIEKDQVNESLKKNRFQEIVKKEEEDRLKVLSQDIRNILEDDQGDNSSMKKSQGIYQTVNGHSTPQYDGKLILLQGQIEKTNKQLLESQHHTQELENIIRQQSLQLSKKENDILLLKSTQRENDGQRMLLRYQLDKSFAKQQQLQLTNGNSSSTGGGEEGRLVSQGNSQELTVISSPEGNIDRYSFLLHINRYQSSLSELKKRFHLERLPPEEIDGISLKSQSTVTPKINTSSSSKAIHETSSPRTTSQDTGAKAESQSTYHSHHHQDEFSDYIRAKFGLTSNDTKGTLLSSTQERTQKNTRTLGSTLPLQPHSSTSTNKLNSSFDIPEKKFPMRSSQQNPFTVNDIFPDRHLPPPRGRSQYQLESDSIHDEVRRFRIFMDEMRAECALGPAGSVTFSQSRPSSTFPVSNARSSHPSKSFSSQPLPPSSTAGTPLDRHSTSTWRTSFDTSFMNLTREEPLEESFRSSTRAPEKDPVTPLPELNFNHLRNISRSPPLSHFSSYSVPSFSTFPVRNSK